MFYHQEGLGEVSDFREELGRVIYLTKPAESCEKILFYSHPITVSQVIDPNCYREASACICTNEKNCPGIKNPKCKWVANACDYTEEGTWVNGVMKSGAAAFVVFKSFHERKELTVGGKITFADGSTRTIMNVSDSGDTLIVYLDGPPLDGNKVGYPKKIKISDITK